MKNGAMNSAGMLAAMNSVWNGARADVVVPAPAIPTPSRAEKRLPAQVGQPTKRPVVAPIPPMIEFFVRSVLLSR